MTDAARAGAHRALADARPAVFWSDRPDAPQLDGQVTERTDLAMVRSRPFPFPLETLRCAGVQLTRRSLARSDRRGGRRGAWLGLLDRFGIGFDS